MSSSMQYSYMQMHKITLISILLISIYAYDTRTNKHTYMQPYAKIVGKGWGLSRPRTGGASTCSSLIKGYSNEHTLTHINVYVHAYRKTYRCTRTHKHKSIHTYIHAYLNTSTHTRT